MQSEQGIAVAEDEKIAHHVQEILVGIRKKQPRGPERPATVLGGAEPDDVLREVALHPAMGRYLSHVGNQKARPEINQYPDENFAREVQQLFSIGLWELNPDGTLKGRPEVVSQSGITDSNRPQAALHAERAIRAVQLAAPFDLPEEFYDRWRRIREWRFDRRL